MMYVSIKIKNKNNLFLVRKNNLQNKEVKTYKLKRRKNWS